jgi:ureidoacrylate peracid hydrolase
MTDLPFRQDPAHTALIVVDVQNDFCDPRGSIAGVGTDVSAAVEMVPRLEKLIDSARSAGVPVIFIQTLHDETNDSTSWLDRTSAEPGTSSTGFICRTGTWGAELYRVRPRPGELTVVKHRYSAFVGTSLQLILTTLGIRSLLFTGVTTDVCVDSSLRDGLANGFFVSLVEDCAAAYWPDAHENAARVVARNFGTVVTSDELAAVWAGIPVPA